MFFFSAPEPCPPPVPSRVRKNSLTNDLSLKRKRRKVLKTVEISEGKSEECVGTREIGRDK